MQKLFDDSIKLIESTHKYILKQEPNFEFTSCTSFAKYFFETFDTIGIANRLTETHPNYIHLSPQELVSDWDKTAKEGTFIHNEVENFIKENINPTHPKSILAAEWIKKNIIEKDKFDIFSEVIVYSKELALAGTIDLLIYDRENNTYKILDWKTNKRIDTQSFNNKLGNHEASANLMDCNFSHYSIQLSLYRYILENYYGLTVTGTAISHLMDSGIQFYKTDYHKAEIQMMLKADRTELKQRSEDCLTTDYL
ncbi:MAG: PD-(D/E)XK nuclease family protein [Bacteroidetes bacterium]|nr:PD-(D/E)XK nuclease family protein [Bacteroidota bacterium]